MLFKKKKTKQPTKRSGKIKGKNPKQQNKLISLILPSMPSPVNTNYT